MVLGKPLSHAIDKNQLKMDIRNLNVIPINIKLLGEKIIKTFLDIEMDNDFFI